MNLKKLSITLLGLLLGASLLLTGCDLLGGGQAGEPTPIPTVSAPTKVIAEGRLMPNDHTWLGFSAGGEVVELNVAIGDEVRQGDVLARLETPAQLPAALKAAELEQLAARQALDTLERKAELATAQALAAFHRAQKAAIEAEQRLDDLDTDAYQEKIDDAWLKVQENKDALDDARENFDKYKDLAVDNPTRKRAKTDLDNAQKKYDDSVRAHDLLKNALELARAEAALAQAALADAQETYEARRAGPDPDEKALLTARLAAADAQYSAAMAAMDDLELRAPYDGRIIYLDLAVGEQARPGVQVMRIADFSAWYIETTDLTEMEVVRLDIGKPVRITPDALPGLKLFGQIESIAEYALEKVGDVLYTVRIRVDQADPRLRWGMTMSLEFEVLEEE